MPKSKITSKFQLTVPKEVREKVGLRAGEIVEVKSVGEGEIVVRRLGRSTKNPLERLVGKTQFHRHVPIDELEGKVEMR